MLVRDYIFERLAQKILKFQLFLSLFRGFIACGASERVFYSFPRFIFFVLLARRDLDYILDFHPTPYRILFANHFKMAVTQNAEDDPPDSGPLKQQSVQQEVSSKKACEASYAENGTECVICCQREEIFAPALTARCKHSTNVCSACI